MRYVFFPELPFVRFFLEVGRKWLTFCSGQKKKMMMMMRKRRIVARTRRRIERAK